MAWTVPLTWVDGVMATAAQLNAQLRDNLLVSEAGVANSTTGPIVATGANAVTTRVVDDAIVETAQPIISAGTYQDLATAGPSVTITTGAQAMVWINAYVSHTGTNQSTRVSFEVSGATTVAASDTWAIFTQTTGAGIAQRMGRARLVTGLTPGSNTFKMKYLSATTGATFRWRRIQVWAL